MGVVTIYEILDILDPQDDYKIQATDSNGSLQTLISSDSVLSYMIRKYGSRQYKIYRGTHTTESEAADMIHLDWRMYLNNRQHGIDRMYQAMYNQTYSPIENVFANEHETTRRDLDTTYGKTETGSHSDTTTYGKTETGQHSDTTTHNTSDAHTGTETNLRNGNRVVENQKAGFNAQNTYTKDNRSTETFNGVQDMTTYNTADTKTGTEGVSGSNSLTHGGTDSVSGSNSLSYGGKDQVDDSTTREFTRHGNVGVTSSQELINQELDLYQKSLAEMLINNFIDDYTFYA